MQLRNIKLDLNGIQRLVEATQSKFNPKDLELVRTSLENYEYGKDLGYLLSQGACFKVTSGNGTLTLKNWERRDSYKGVCGELANSLGLSLIRNGDFNSKYDVVLATGSHAKYFPHPSIHAFLLIAPKEINIRKQLTDNPSKFPEGVILTDPSIGKLEIASENNNKDDGYKLCIASFDRTSSFGEVEISAGDVQFDLRRNSPHPAVIGFTEDYLPGSFTDAETLYAVFQTNDSNQIKDVTLASFNPLTGQPSYIDLSTFSRDEKQVLNLKSFLGKLKGDLGLA